MKEHISQKKKQKIDTMLAANEILIYHIERNIEKIEKLLHGEKVLQGEKADRVVVDEESMWADGQDTEYWPGHGSDPRFSRISHDG